MLGNLLCNAVYTVRRAPGAWRLRRALARLPNREYTVRREGLWWSLDSARDIERRFLVGDYEPLTAAWMRSVIRPDWVCLDIGANFGRFALLMASLARRVVAFEPIFGERLHRNIALNRLPNVGVFECGLSDNAGTATFAASNSNASIDRAAWSESQPVSAKLRTLDDCLREFPTDRIDLIKLDVDGHEARVLAGAAETLQRFHPLIAMETAPAVVGAGAVDSAVAHLRSLGYRPTGDTLASEDNSVFAHHAAATQARSRALNSSV